jgi:oligopeptide/dipeptide ABC transporter ATP-binding protein
MYAGKIVETAAPLQLFESPKHPYTKALLESLPDITKPIEDGPLPALAGQPPRMIRGMIPNGCLFSPRCSSKIGAICDEIDPPETIIAEGRTVRCHLYNSHSEHEQS